MGWPQPIIRCRTWNRISQSDAFALARSASSTDTTRQSGRLAEQEVRRAYLGAVGVEQGDLAITVLCRLDEEIVGHVVAVGIHQFERQIAERQVGLAQVDPVDAVLEINDGVEVPRTLEDKEVAFGAAGQKVLPVATVDAVASGSAEHVVRAFAAQQPVVAGIPVQEIVAGIAVKGVDAVAATRGIVAVAAMNAIIVIIAEDRVFGSASVDQVGPCAATDGVEPVLPVEAIRAGSARQDVIAFAPADPVGARLTVGAVVILAAVDGVVARPAVYVVFAFVPVEEVGAATAIDLVGAAASEDRVGAGVAGRAARRVAVEDIIIFGAVDGVCAVGPKLASHAGPPLR